MEQGVTNEIFQTKRDETAGCIFNGTPEDHTQFDAVEPIKTVSDVVAFTHFMRFLAPPQSLPLTSSARHGKNLFTTVGCVLCHTPSMNTGPSSSAALSNKPVNLYSDLLVHHMGKGLSDGIKQGKAAEDEFRTAPLWGIGQRLFFLHDGRTSDLTTAIVNHSSQDSEANMVIKNFQKLSQSDKKDLIEFLMSL